MQCSNRLITTRIDIALSFAMQCSNRLMTTRINIALFGSDYILLKTAYDLIIIYIALFDSISMI